MAKGSPSMIALLGLLAVAGYQNRDRLGAMLNSGASDVQSRNPAGGRSGNEGGLLDNLREMSDNLTGGRSDGSLTGGRSDGSLTGAGTGGIGLGGLMAGLSELMERLTNAGQRTKAQSWISSGRNESISTDEVEKTLDDETIAELVEKTGLPRGELLERLSQALPDAVDQATPDGQFPPLAMQEPRLV